MAKVLILDQSKSIRNTLRERLEFEGIAAESAENEAAASVLCERIPFDLIISDHETRLPESDVPFIVLSSEATVDSAIKALRNGAQDYLTKPIDMNRLMQSIRQTLEQAAEAPRTAAKAKAKRSSAGHTEEIIGTSEQMQHVRRLIDKVAPCDARVLITGENGTGKELVARWLHAKSNRAGAPFVEVNCAAIPSELIESELFGHVKGSFTDAHADRAGKFEAASRSTLFLDEIGNLPYHLQAKLLTAIQRRSIVRVGSNTPIPVDIRLICATNRNLPEMVAKGEFREDLLYRINTIHLEIPSLRERPEDIIPLAELFIARFCKQYDKPPVRLTDGACEKLTLHPWYGNIRELEHAIEKAIIICDNETLPAELFQLARRTGTPEAAASTLEEMEMQMIRKTLDKCSGNLSAVAAQLGITRQTLYNKMKKYGL